MVRDSCWTETDAQAQISFIARPLVESNEHLC
jgi:hypothetical protein